MAVSPLPRGAGAAQHPPERPDGARGRRARTPGGSGPSIESTPRRTPRDPMRLLLLIFATDLLAIVLVSQLARMIAGG
ncbi:MAG: hypothetical protein J0H14_04600 [Alphaproteobacteria bacterium]|nr:hypothetical protein [Alphaproteobacteria bacterium]